MFGKKRPSIGRYQFLMNKNTHNKYKRLLSVDFENMPFYKYVIALTAMLEEQFFVNTLLVGQAQRETDITWFIKDYTVNLDFVAEDFKQFQLDEDLYKDVNLIEQNFLTFEPEKKYDLIVVLDDITRIYQNLHQIMKQIDKVAAKQARIIFFIRYYTEDQIIDDNINLLKSTDEFLKYLPFDVRSKVELKNYNKGQLASFDLIVDSYKP